LKAHLYYRLWARRSVNPGRKEAIVPIGTVLRYERKSGFGFIRTEKGQEVFVHHTGLVDREFLVAGQEVRFKIEVGERGPRAVNVTVTREVSLKRHRQLDWRGRRGKAPRPGTLPQASRPPEPEDEMAADGEAG
jgi:CspA family cold shock protein